MTCQELTQFIIDYLEGDLPQPAREVFEHHLSICGDCRHYLDNYRKTMALEKVSMTFDAPSDSPLPKPLVDAILAARRAQSRL